MDNGKWTIENWAKRFTKKILNCQFSIVNSHAYTLIELLVVIAIISLLSLVGYVSFKSFSADQVAVKAAGQIQSYLRLAQTNASTSTNCNNQPATGWSLVWHSTSVDLMCNDTTLLKSYVLDTNATVTSTCSSTIKYVIGSGMLTADTSAPCTFTVSNTLTPAASKTITVTTGGTINVR